MLNGDYDIRNLLNWANTVYIPLEDTAPFRSVDTPADLEEAKPDLNHPKMRQRPPFPKKLGRGVLYLNSLWKTLWKLWRLWKLFLYRPCKIVTMGERTVYRAVHGEETQKPQTN